MNALDPGGTKLEREFKHARPLIGCRFDPSGRFLFASAEDNSIQRYDLIAGTRTALTGHASWVRGMAFLMPAPSKAAESVRTDAARRQATRAGLGFAAATRPAPQPLPFALVSGDYHGNLLWWDGAADAPKPIRRIHAHTGWVRAVAASPDGTMLASCGNDNAVKLWTADGRPIRTLEGHASHVYNVAFHPDGRQLASQELKGIVKDWDLKTGTSRRDLDCKVLHKYDPTFMADIGGARAMAFSPDGGTLAVAGITNVSNAFAGVGNPLVLLFDWKSGQSKQLKPKEGFQGTMWGVAFHPSGSVLAAAGGSAGRLWFWKKDELTSSHTVNAPASARDMTLDPLGTRVALAGSNGAAWVYALKNG